MYHYVLIMFLTMTSLSLIAKNNQVCGTQTKNKLTVMTDEQGNQRLWSKEDRQQLTYCISKNFKELKPVIMKALEVATADWMDAAGVTFTHVVEEDQNCHKRKQNETRFKVTMARTRNYPFAARAFFPYDERRTLTFKKSFVEGDFNELQRIARHEIGHILGLRHEHIRNENPYRDQCLEDDLFDPITDYDNASIMHYARCGGVRGTTELSLQDRVGIALLYPKDP